MDDLDVISSVGRGVTRGAGRWLGRGWEGAGVPCDR
jgi:hypothetical protein